MKRVSGLLLLALLQINCEGGRFAQNYSATNAADDQQKTGETPNPSGQGENPEGSDGKNHTTIGENTHSENLASCNGKKGKKAVHISSSEQSVVLKAQDAPSVKVTGDQNKVDWKLAANESIDALCLDIMGNQNQVELNVDGSIGEIRIKARGNQPKIVINTNAGATVKNVVFDEAGNDGSLLMRGEGAHPCAPEKGIICE